jgi:hypothetical protein
MHMADGVLGRDGGRFVARRGLVIAGVVGAVIAAAGAQYPLPVTPRDLLEPGTQPQQPPQQPFMITDPMPTAQDGCFLCHSGRFEDVPAETVKPGRWRGSLHAHSYRDPIFQAAFVIANQDAPGGGEACLRCHTPRAFYEGRATPPTGNPDGSTLFATDIDEGVTCNVCHRMVDPLDRPGPAADDLIRAVLEDNGLLPQVAGGNTTAIIDPMDVRRGPIEYGPEEFGPPHLFATSPFHRSSDLCGTCHEVSNPLMTRVGGPIPAATDTYVLNAMNTPHSEPLSDQDKYNMFPEQRTYSEWAQSSFATTPGGLFIPDEANPLLNRFGGNQLTVSTCQDCHMPRVTGQLCDLFEPPVRSDIGYHSFVGANVFAIDLLLHLYGPSGTGEFDEYTVSQLTRARVETIEMLGKATDSTATQYSGELTVRTTNQTGHKLLTGMPEGRRIWKNVKFFNAANQLIDERGAYNSSTAVLSETDTKVYEAKLGLDEYMAGVTGKPVGPSFNLLLVNKVFKDNRIPPRGFTNAGFESVQAKPVAYSYADGQFWDDTRYCVPPGAVRAEMRLFYQTSSKEYIEFLRDENRTDGRGTLLHDAWAAVGRSAPVEMDRVLIDLAPFAVGDANNNGATDFSDVTTVLASFGSVGGGLASGDVNCDGVTNFSDVTTVLANFGSVATP